MRVDGGRTKRSGVFASSPYMLLPKARYFYLSLYGYTKSTFKCFKKILNTFLFGETLPKIVCKIFTFVVGSSPSKL